jgi:hypothetical protein
MSSSIILLTNVDAPAPFEREKVLAAVKNLCGIKNCRDGGEIGFTDDLLLDCRYSFDDDATNISIPQSLMSVDIEGTRDISLHAAISIQRDYGESVFAILAHSPDINCDLASVGSVKELRVTLDL